MMDNKRMIECVLLRHNNPGLHDTLEKMGFAKLSWTISMDNRQILIASSFPYTKTDSGYSRKVIKEYKGSFWNNGIVAPKGAGNCLDCLDDEEKFMSIAEKLISEKYIWVDRDGNETEKPEWFNK
jgi:hypothetical protein